MPTKRLRLSKMEQIEYRTSCRQLEELGIEIGTAEDFRPQRVRFTLEQGEPELARVYDLPGGDVAAVLPAKLTILKSGVMFTDALVVAAWESFPLDLEGAEENRYFDRFKRLGPSWEPIILNDFLVGRAHPLQPCQWDGFIIGTGWASVPAECDDGARLRLELRLRDEQGTDFHYDFTAAVDQRFKREYERSRPAPSVTTAALANRVSLLEGKAEPSMGAEACRRYKEARLEEQESPKTYRETIDFDELVKMLKRFEKDVGAARTIAGQTWQGGATESQDSVEGKDEEGKP